MEVDIQQSSPPLDWDASVSGMPGNGFCQSTTWARIIQRADRATPLFLQAKQSGSPVASLLLFEKNFSHHRSKRMLQTLSHLIRGKWPTWLEWQDGPVFHSLDHEQQCQALASVLDWSGQTSLVNGYVSLRGVVRFSDDANQLRSYSQVFSEKGCLVHRRATLIVDLSQSEEELWLGLDRAARKNINKAKRLGLQVRLMRTRQEVKSDFYKHYVYFEKHASRSSTPAWVLDIMWEEDREKYYRYFVAQNPNGEVLGTLGIHIYDGKAVEIASSMSLQAHKEGLPIQDLLHWEIITYAKQQGAHTFDLAGIDPDPQDAKARGIRRFKEKWGGDYREFLGFSLALKAPPGVRLSRAIKTLLP